MYCVLLKHTVNHVVCHGAMPLNNVSDGDAQLSSLGVDTSYTVEAPVLTGEVKICFGFPL